MLPEVERVAALLEAVLLQERSASGDDLPHPRGLRRRHDVSIAQLPVIDGDRRLYSSDPNRASQLTSRGILICRDSFYGTDPG